MKKTTNNSKNNKLKLIVLIVFALIGTFVLTRIFAEGTNVRLTSASSTVEKGKTFSVTIRANTGSTGVTVGQAHLVFNPAQLEYVSVNTDNSSFSNVSPENKSGSGFVKVSRFSLPPFPSGDLILGTVNFKMLAESGSVNIGVEGAAIDKTYFANADDSSNIVTSTTGISFQATKAQQPDPTDPTEPEPVVVPVTPGGGTTPEVPRGTPLIPQANSTTQSGQEVTSTDYYVDGEFVGSSSGPDDPLSIDTNNLNAGEHEITARSKTADGSAEESKQTFQIKDDSFIAKYKLPIIISSSAIFAVIIGIIIRITIGTGVPFYKTLR